MNINKIILKFLKGKFPLWKSYWLVGELLNALIIIIIINIEISFFNNSNFISNIPFFNFTDLSLINRLIIFFWTIFITVGIWRSAENYKGNILWTILTLIVLSYRLFVLKEIFY